MVCLSDRNHADVINSYKKHFLEGNCSNRRYRMPNVDTVDQECLLNCSSNLNLHSTQLLSIKFFTLMLAAIPSRNLWKFLLTPLKLNWVCVPSSES